MLGWVAIRNGECLQLRRRSSVSGRAPACHWRSLCKRSIVPVTLRQLRYFKAVVEHGSFSRAAEGVHVSQPALSLQIRELESGLGAALFERDSHGVVLTPLGRVAHEQTLRILDEALLLETMGRRFNEGPFRVALGVISTLAPYLMTELLKQLDSAPVRLELDVVEAPSGEIVADLLAGRLDAAIVSLPLGLLELEERPLFEDRFLVAGRAKRLETFRMLGDAPRAADLAKSDIGPLLTLGERHCLGDQVLGACSMWRVEDIRRGSESIATVSRLVANGAGLTLVPETSALCERAASPGLSFLRLAPPEPSRRIGLTHRVASHDQPWIELLVTAATKAGLVLTNEAREAIGTTVD